MLTTKTSMQQKLTLFRERLKHAMEKSGIKQAELAQRTGITQQTIQYLCSKAKVGSSHTTVMAKVLGVEELWLARGTGPMTRNLGKSKGQFAAPILEWDDLLEWPECLTDDKLEGTRTVDHGLGAQASSELFALKLIDNAMVSLDTDIEGMTPIGSFIIVEPQIKPEYGDWVVAVVEKAGIRYPVFRVYQPSGPNVLLTALNPNCQPIQTDVEHCKIIGVMMEGYSQSVRRRP